ncbi:MAG: hypothetical protein A2X97_09405 [Bdellovibrionales bacterium GWA1_52_35]|nr:MAG: hypothetical protein A2X97_09405 [Bdellovibrionales bacterium GWA1_52_35]
MHTRQRGHGKFSTYDAHYPEQKLAAVRFDVQLARKEALKIGPETTTLVEELLSGSHPLRFLRRVQGLLVKRLKQVPTLILDDFGLRNYTHEEATILVDMLEERYQKGSVIVTSQVDPKGWKKLFEDPVIGDAIVDRLTKPSRTVKFTGSSYRDKLKSKSN